MFYRPAQEQAAVLCQNVGIPFSEPSRGSLESLQIRVYALDRVKY